MSCCLGFLVLTLHCIELFVFFWYWQFIVSYCLGFFGTGSALCRAACVLFGTDSALCRAAWVLLVLAVHCVVLLVFFWY